MSVTSCCESSLSPERIFQRIAGLGTSAHVSGSASAVLRADGPAEWRGGLDPGGGGAEGGALG